MFLGQNWSSLGLAAGSTHVVMKCVARLWLPLFAKEGGRIRVLCWQPALLCWSKHKLLLPGDRRQHWSVASPFPRQSALWTWMSKPSRWVILRLYFITPSCASWHSCAAWRTSKFRSFSFFFFSQSHTTPCCYLAVTHNGARLIFFALELCAFSFNLAANAILVEPAMFIVCLNSGSSLFDNRLRLRSTPGASMWVDGTSARSFCPDLPSCSSSPLVCLFCLFLFFPLHSTHWRWSFFSSYSVAECLSMWAAVEPVSTCRWAEAILVLHISWMDLVRL